MRRVALGAALVCAIGLGTALSAQAPQGQAAPGQGRGGGRGPALTLTNLQVFPKDTPAPQVLQAMQAFEAALGVGCEHCHVYIGRGNPMNDFASDMKPTKNIARAMMRLTQAANTQIAAAVTQKPASDVTQVRCITCHRGAAIPQVAAAAAAAPGANAAPTPPATPNVNR